MVRGTARLALCLASLLLIGWASAVNIEDTCDETAKCEIVGAACTDAKCMCLADYTPSADKTKCEQGSIGGVCLDTLQCVVASTICEGADGSKKCTCDDKYVPSTDNKKCLPVAASTDGDCEIDAQCSTPFANSKCDTTKKKCMCLDTHVESSMKDKCLMKLSDFDTVCDETQQCILANSECSGDGTERKCKCSGGFIVNSAKDECLKSADLVGDECTAAEPAVCSSIENAECKNDKCICKADYVSSLNAESCLKIAGDTLGGDCVESQQCTGNIMHSECVNKKCACSSTYVAALNSKSCLQKMNYNETCAEAQQCTDMTPGNVDCIGQMCKCKPENHFFELKCWEDIKLDQECNNENECILSGGDMADVQCIVGKCTCIVDHIPDVENNKCNSGVTNTVAVISMAFVFAAAKLF